MEKEVRPLAYGEIMFRYGHLLMLPFSQQDVKPWSALLPRVLKDPRPSVITVLGHAALGSNVIRMVVIILVKVGHFFFYSGIRFSDIPVAIQSCHILTYFAKCSRFVKLHEFQKKISQWTSSRLSDLLFSCYSHCISHLCAWNAKINK